MYPKEPVHGGSFGISKARLKKRQSEKFLDYVRSGVLTSFGPYFL